MSRNMKRLFYFVIAALLSAGLVSYIAPSRAEAMYLFPGVLGILLLLFGGKDLYLYWLSYKAERASKEGNRKQVKNLYYKIYRFDPEGFVGKFSLGVIHSVDGYWVHAVTNFRRALQMRPKSMETIFNLGICLIRLGRYKEALNYLSFLASKKPRWNFLFCAMGEAYYHLEDYKEACACLQRELFFYPGNKVARELLALAQKAQKKAA